MKTWAPDHEHKWQPTTIYLGGEAFDAARCTICGTSRLAGEIAPPTPAEQLYPIPCTVCYIGGPLGFGRNCGRRLRAQEAGQSVVCAVCGAEPGPAHVLWWQEDRWLCEQHTDGLQYVDEITALEQEP